MGFKRIVNGVEVSESESEAHMAKMVSRHGGIAGMVEAKRGPGLNGTDTAMQNRIARDDISKRVSPAKLERMKARAAAAGITVNRGMAYCAQLADFEDDPKAWVDPTTTRGDIKRRLEAEGNGSEEFGVEVRVENPDRRVHRLAPDVATSIAHQMFDNDPVLLERCQKDDKFARNLMNEIVENHGAPADV